MPEDEELYPENNDEQAWRWYAPQLPNSTIYFHDPSIPENENSPVGEILPWVDIPVI